MKGAISRHWWHYHKTRNRKREWLKIIYVAGWQDSQGKQSSMAQHCSNQWINQTAHPSQPTQRSMATAAGTVAVPHVSFLSVCAGWHSSAATGCKWQSTRAIVARLRDHFLFDGGCDCCNNVIRTESQWCSLTLKLSTAVLYNKCDTVLSLWTNKFTKWSILRKICTQDIRLVVHELCN